ncbi:MAG: hypothetical protein RBU30_08650 [Polyangia bacterium]|jgi:hypothetical protein|nr:hypothetical protein [Polyangia bacterium]
MRLTPRRKSALVVALVVIGLLGVVVGRVLLGSRAAYLEGLEEERRALSRTDPKERSEGLKEAVVRYRRAARFYAPGNGYVERSLGRLQAIGLLAEQGGDLETALEAYRSVRRAILGARSFYTPHKGHLARANARIALLMAAQEEPQAEPETLAKREAWHRAQLSRDQAPSVGWAILALFGFFGWVGAAVGFVFGAVTPEDRLKGRQALIWGAAILAGLLVWLLGLTRA